MSSRQAKARALLVAATQHGAIHLDQAVAAGLSRDAVYRFARTGEWRRLMSKVFATDRRTKDGRQRLMAACLWAGEGGAASHRSAGELWNLDGVPSGYVEISVPGRPSRPDRIIIHRATTRLPVNRVDGIPTTSATRTLLDLATVLRDEALELALEDALRRRLVSIPKLQMAIHECRGQRGTRVLRGLVSARVDVVRPTDSSFEVKLMQILADAQLPRPRVQHYVQLPGGGEAFLDFAYPEIRVGIEADSYRWHSGRAAWSKDRTRLNELVALGWRIFHVTYEDLCTGAIDLINALRRMFGQQRFADE